MIEDVNEYSSINNFKYLSSLSKTGEYTSLSIKLSGNDTLSKEYVVRFGLKREAEIDQDMPGY